MSVELQIISALALDLALGDPRWRWHPVRMIGRLAGGMEPIARAFFTSARLAGAVTALVTVCVVTIVCLAIITGCGLIDPLAGDLAGVFILYASLSARGLADHARDVYRFLLRGDIAVARQRAGRMVGRDTARLDESGIVRATAESVAENTSDGVVAPLFFAAVFGPAGAMVYKAVNTMDSMFGYKNDRYTDFGRVAAKLDDLANFVPARITAFSVFVAAVLLSLRFSDSIRISIRDGHKHPSPNSGWPEAAFAGAMGVRFGGPSEYGGEMCEKPFIGENAQAISREHINTAIKLMYLSSVVSALLFAGARALANT